MVTAIIILSVVLALAVIALIVLAHASVGKQEDVAQKAADGAVTKVLDRLDAPTR